MEKTSRNVAFWFDIPAAYGANTGPTGNPWAILMLPIAMTEGEDISIPYPVDARLLENIKGLSGVWHSWFPQLRPAEIHAPVISSAASTGTGRAMFFSGGVDSFFTLLRHDTELVGCASGLVDTLIFVEGFDLPLSARSEAVKARETLQGVASDFGKAFLPISTNLREPKTAYDTNWILAHGCAMATIAHLLEASFYEIIISSSFEYADMIQIGSHPLTDPLLGSRSTRIIHDGASFNRAEKLAAICASEPALRSLRVCYASKTHENCSRCPKCLFTMVTIDALGCADRALSFDWNLYTPETIGKLILSDLQIFRANKLIATAQATGRHALVAGLRQAIGRSIRVRRAFAVVQRLPFLWRYDYQIKQFLLRHL